jgi:hypothetical protein
LQAEIRKLSKEARNGAFSSGKGAKGTAEAFSLMEESDRLEVKVQADLTALGVSSCVGPRPQKPIGG